MSPREVWVVEYEDMGWHVWKAFGDDYMAEREMKNTMRAWPHWIMRLTRYVPAPIKKRKAKTAKEPKGYDRALTAWGGNL